MYVTEDVSHVDTQRTVDEDRNMNVLDCLLALRNFNIETAQTNRRLENVSLMKHVVYSCIKLM